MSRRYSLRLKASLVVFFLSTFFCSASAFSAQEESLKNLADPTRPLQYSPAAKSKKKSLSLQAIFIRSSGNATIINGKQLKVGDAVSGYKVTGIQNTTVTLTKDGITKTLGLRKSVVNK